jgi:lipopolysaccharide export LptBFGC system permease protein LptF
MLQMLSNLLGRAIVVLAALSTVLSLVEPALAAKTAVPAPIVGAGLPVLAILAGGYWLIRKVRQRR